MSKDDDVTIRKEHSVYITARALNDDDELDSEDVKAMVRADKKEVADKITLPYPPAPRPPIPSRSQPHSGFSHFMSATTDETSLSDESKITKAKLKWAMSLKSLLERYVPLFHTQIRVWSGSRLPCSVLSRAPELRKQHVHRDRILDMHSFTFLKLTT